MHSRKVRAVLAALGAGALLAAAPAQAGKPKPVKTKPKIQKIDATGASGKTKAKQKACRKGRKISLYLIGDYVPVRVGKDKTDKKGKWRVDATLEPGNYFAKAKKKKVRVDGKKVTCKAGESKSKSF